MRGHQNCTHGWSLADTQAISLKSTAINCTCLSNEVALHQIIIDHEQAGMNIANTISNKLARVLAACG
jgi:hypothetical protein